MPIRAILFDLDGTLIDQFEAIHRAFVRVLTQMGFPEPSFESVKRSVGGASETTMTKLIGSDRAKEAVRLLRPIFEEEMLDGLKALPGSHEILESCKAHGLKTAVLTNKHGPHARAACDHLHFSESLAFTLGANDTDWKKPDPRLTNYALEKIGAGAEETLYLGDSPYDYDTASEVGMKCLLVATGTHSISELNKLSATSVDQNLFDVAEKTLPSLLLDRIDSKEE
jgi:HAD superfamily hydrolase (TIGR01509 family)